jgi:transcriptional regulator with XRE-family HTH domain
MFFKVCYFEFIVCMEKPKEQSGSAFRIGEKIRRLRENKGLKQENMARRMGLTTNGYGKIERGESSITLDRLEEIANVLEVSAMDILQMDDHFVYNINTMNQSATNGIVNNYSLTETERETLFSQIASMQKIIEMQNQLIQKLTIHPSTRSG